MGKTLKRAKKRADALNTLKAGSKPFTAAIKGSSIKSNSNSRRRLKEAVPRACFSSRVSVAFSGGDWDEAVKALEAMRRAGEVPKLGAVQRWVRLADMVGDPHQVARLLSAILRSVPGGGPIALSDAAAKHSGKAGSGGIRHYPPWCPPLTQQQQTWVAARETPASAAAAAADRNGLEAAAAAAAGAGEPSCPAAAAAAGSGAQATVVLPSFSLVEQDSSMQPAKRPPNFQELTIYALAPHTIRFGPDPTVVRHDVPFVPGAFVLAGLLSPDECRQIIAATEAIGYSWDVDYTFNPSSRNSEKGGDQQPGAPEPDGEVYEEDMAGDQNEEEGRRQQQQHGNAALIAGGAQKVGGVNVEGQRQQQQQQCQSKQSPLHSEQYGAGVLPQPDSGHCVEQQGSGQQLGQSGCPGERGGSQTVQHARHAGEKRGLDGLLPGQSGAQSEADKGKAGKKANKKRKHKQQLLQQQQQQQPAPAQPHPLLSAARAAAGGDRAAGCVLLADDSLLGPIVRRASALMPQELCGGRLAGINCRLRCYRYDAGNVYRPHVDGAWPGSGMKNGKMVHDAYGDRWSRLTFLVYLNDDFEGGATTFFTPAADSMSALQARGVTPRAGNVLCFTHGDTASALVHEGSAVKSGKKYVIRTDVLYTLPTSVSS